MIKIFGDTEFTGLKQETTLISIGLKAETGQTFYAELTDYDKLQVNDWIQHHVIDNLFLGPEHESVDKATAQHIRFRGEKKYAAQLLKEWFRLHFPPVQQCQLWWDCGAYDHVLLTDLLADYTKGYPSLPPQLHYISMDLATLLELAGLDPDINREHLAGDVMNLPPDSPLWFDGGKHNALWDALVIEQCYRRAKAVLEHKYITGDDAGVYSPNPQSNG